MSVGDTDDDPARCASSRSSPKNSSAAFIASLTPSENSTNVVPAESPIDSRSTGLAGISPAGRPDDGKASRGGCPGGNMTS